MHHLRRSNASSFFAPAAVPLGANTPNSSYPHFNLHPNETLNPTSNANINLLDPMNPAARGTLYPDTNDPNNGGDEPQVEIDEETRRWLIAYPTDPQLVGVIADLRTNKPNPDFLISSVGLLYLKPETDDQPALLVPPAGEIREEILQDAHLDPDDIEGEVLTAGGRVGGGSGPSEGALGHWGVIRMLEVLGGTFWWDGIEGDVERFVGGCEVCRKRGLGRGPVGYEIGDGEGMEGEKEGEKTGWTAGENTMAAEMAFAMRKAGEGDLL